MPTNELALIYSGPDGRTERIADITVHASELRITAYGYSPVQVSDLVPTMTGDIQFWRNPVSYKKVLVQTHGTEGVPFDQGTVYFRWGTGEIQPTRPITGSITRLPPQEMPDNWSTRIPTRGQIEYRRRRYHDHET